MFICVHVGVYKMQVILDIKEDLLKVLLNISDGDLETFIDEVLREHIDAPGIEDRGIDLFLNLAIEGVSKINKMTEFSIDDVLSNEEWRRLSPGQRKSLGRSFRKELTRLGIASWLRRDSANKAIYLKL